MKLKDYATISLALLSGPTFSQSPEKAEELWNKITDKVELVINEMEKTGSTLSLKEEVTSNFIKIEKYITQAISYIIPATIESSNLNSELSEIPSKTPYKIIVDKSDYQLYIFKNDKLIQQLNITHGFSTNKEKNKINDKATPEGVYFITHHNPNSKYHLSLGISYPNAIDAENGLKKNIINPEESNNIKQKHSQFKTTLQNTNLGGDIFFHGNSGGKFDTLGQWTQGCIRMSNADIEYLFNLIPDKTGIKIRK